MPPDAKRSCQRDPTPRADASDERRDDGQPHLPRLAAGHALGEAQPRDQDIVRAERILNEDHYGLEKVKERILEFLAVRQMAPSKQTQGSILCFVDLPASEDLTGRSIARATGRKFVRLSLAESAMRRSPATGAPTLARCPPDRPDDEKAGMKNPVFLLDEVDKMSMDFRGDPSAALMEVLDPSTTAPSWITISTPSSTCRRCCSSAPPTCCTLSATVAGPHGGHPDLGLHRNREAQYREAPPRYEAARAEGS